MTTCYAHAFVRSKYHLQLLRMRERKKSSVCRAVAGADA